MKSLKTNIIHTYRYKFFQQQKVNPLEVYHFRMKYDLYCMNKTTNDKSKQCYTIYHCKMYSSIFSIH